jgi:hypothetical protein
MEWTNFLKHLKANGVTKVDVTNIYDLNQVNKDKPVESLERYSEVENEDIQKEVDKHLQTPEKELTPEQKQIKELQEALASLTKGTQFKVVTGEKVIELKTDSELKEARAEYEKIVGKKGGPAWTIEQINQKIEDFKALEAARAEYKELFEADSDEALTIDQLIEAIKEKK